MQQQLLELKSKKEQLVLSEEEGRRDVPMSAAWGRERLEARVKELEVRVS